MNQGLRTGALFSAVDGEICQRALDVHAEAIHVTYRNITSEPVEEAHRKGLKVAAWNPDEPEEIRRTMRSGVDAKGSNRPDILLGIMSRQQ